MGSNYTKEALYSAIDSSNEEWIMGILKKFPEYLNSPMTSDCLTTPLSRAAWRGDKNVSDLLITLGADINFTGPSLISPLMWACKRNHKELVVDYFTRGASYKLETSEKLNALDYAILYAGYECALFLIENTDLQPKTIEFYDDYNHRNNLRYCNYKIMIDHLLLKMTFENVPNFTTREIKKQTFNDPVIDPRETWKQFFARIIEFEDPPVIERSELPKNLQPQNRLLGKMRSYINGMSPYPNKDEPKEEMKNLNLGSDKMISEQKPNKEEEPKKVGIYPDLTEIILKKDCKDQNTIN